MMFRSFSCLSTQNEKINLTMTCTFGINVQQDSNNASIHKFSCISLQDIATAYKTIVNYNNELNESISQKPNEFFSNNKIQFGITLKGKANHHKMDNVFYDVDMLYNYLCEHNLIIKNDLKPALTN